MAETSKSVEEILAAAEMAQKKLEEADANELNTTLSTRLDKIQIEKRAAEEAKKTGEAVKQVRGKIAEITGRGGKVAPEMTAAAEQVQNAHDQATSLTETTFNQIKDIESRPDVIGRLQDEAKAEDVVFNRTRAAKSKEQETADAKTQKLREAADLKKQYDVLVAQLKAASTEIQKERDSYNMYLQNGAKSLEEAASDIARLDLADKQLIESTSKLVTNRVGSPSYNEVFYPNLQNMSNDLGEAIDNVGFFKFALKGALKKAKNWVDSNLPEAKIRYDLNQNEEQKYEQVKQKVEAEMKRIAMQVNEKQLWQYTTSTTGPNQEYTRPELNVNGLGTWIRDMNRIYS